MWILTLPLVTNEQSYLREEPIQGHNSLENPEEQEHWVLTRRVPPWRTPTSDSEKRSLGFLASHWSIRKSTRIRSVPNRGTPQTVA